MKKQYQELSIKELNISIEGGLLGKSIEVDPQMVKAVPYKDGFEGISEDGFENGSYKINF